MRITPLLLIGLAAPLAAQGGNDIWLVPLGGTVRAPSAGTPVNVTNRVGYDNQPSFSPDGNTMYFTSQRDGQTDIYTYDVQRKVTTQFTHTPESEYSAQQIPGGKNVSAVRVEADSTQRLWSFGPDGKALRPVFKRLKPIGYYAWLKADESADQAYVYVLGSGGGPATLRYAVRHAPSDSVESLGKEEFLIVATGIGRTIVRSTTDQQIYFAQRDTSGWWVHSFDSRDQTIVKLPSRRDDFFAVTADGDIIAANGNILMQYQRAEEKWIELAKFSEPGLQHITRIAFSPAGDRIAIVGDEPAPPRQ